MAGWSMLQGEDEGRGGSVEQEREELPGGSLTGRAGSAAGGFRPGRARSGLYGPVAVKGPRRLEEWGRLARWRLGLHGNRGNGEDLLDYAGGVVYF